MNKKGRPPGTKKDGLKYLNEDELKSLSSAVKKGRNLKDYLLFALILRLGLRDGTRESA